MVTPYKKIALLYGGPSAEAAVSKVSAAAVAKAFDELGYTYKMVELAGQWMESVKDCDFAFLGLHGCPGEDGTVQSVLDLMGIPYQGSGVKASAVAMDKSMAKKLFAAAGLSVAKEQVFATHDLPASVEDLSIALPLVIKPTSEGSSVGVSVVREESEWPQAVKNACVCGGPVMVEEYIPGLELTVAVMGNKALEVTDITPQQGHDFYNYDSKYKAGGSGHVIPANISKELYARCLDWALKAHQALDCKGVTRPDFRYDPKTDRLVILEVNTLPGLTDVSLVPEQAAYQGISFVELIKWMVEEEKCQNAKIA